MLLSFQVNLVGTLRVTKACLPLLKSCAGRVLMVSSVAGVHAYPGLSVYCATKHAIEGLAQVGLHHAVSVMHTSLEYWIEIAFYLCIMVNSAKVFFSQNLPGNFEYSVFWKWTIPINVSN
jgi:hypothetical protein